MRVRPSGPCHTPYMPAMFARRTCAVQMLEVAFSRRICCSRVCSARRRAGRPMVSVLTPTRRPGIERAWVSSVAMNAACGPPNPIGTPRRCDEPTAISKPSCPGGTMREHASRSVTAMATEFCSCMRVVNARIISGDSMWPLLPGHETTTAKNPVGSHVAMSPSVIEMPIGSMRVRNTAIVCG